MAKPKTHIRMNITLPKGLAVDLRKFSRIHNTKMSRTLADAFIRMKKDMRK